MGVEVVTVRSTVVLLVVFQWIFGSPVIHIGGILLGLHSLFSACFRPRKFPADKLKGESVRGEGPARPDQITACNIIMK